MSRSSLNLPYITFSGAVIVALVVAIFGVWPAVNNISAINAQTDEVRTSTAASTQALASLQTKFNQLEVHKQNEKEINVILPDQDSVEDIMRIIDRAGVAGGVALNSVSNSTNTVRSSIRASRNKSNDANTMPAGVAPIEMHVKASGSYQQIRTFITELESAPRLANVQSVSFVGNDKAPDQITVEISVRFYTYQP